MGGSVLPFLLLSSALYSPFFSPWYGGFWGFGFGGYWGYGGFGGGYYNHTVRCACPQPPLPLPLPSLFLNSAGTAGQSTTNL